MSQKQTLSLNAVIDLIEASGQIVPLEQWIPSCNRSQCTTVHHKTQCTTVHHSAPQDTRGFAMLPETKFGPSQKIVVFAVCQMPIVFGIR